VCGRYTLNLRSETFADAYGVQPPLDFAPRYNIAPTQSAPIIRPDADGILESLMLRWGFPAVQGRPLINARGETVNQKPSFREAFHERRVLVPSTGYFEWQTRGTQKQPFHLRLEEQSPFAFAGLWTRDAEREVFTIITTSANDATRAIHDRQPVILEAESWQAWLDPDAAPRDLTDLLHSHERLEAYPVSNRVGSVKNDDAALLEGLNSASR
jgi:putative SOS response-associated peptidase YedK